MGKVKFGLRDFYYGVLDGNDKVTKAESIKHLPGMKSAKLDITMDLTLYYQVESARQNLKSSC
ncbi:major tail protein [Streptococcus pyogenes]|nr:major tail protein [Streptococcus pyogenes]